MNNNKCRSAEESYTLNRLQKTIHNPTECKSVNHKFYQAGSMTSRQPAVYTILQKLCFESFLKTPAAAGRLTSHRLVSVFGWLVSLLFVHHPSEKLCFVSLLMTSHSLVGVFIAKRHPETMFLSFLNTPAVTGRLVSVFTINYVMYVFLIHQLSQVGWSVSLLSIHHPPETMFCVFP